MIVLAGGIGSGKSVVARLLRLKGYGVYDCDFEAKRLMVSDPSVIRAIKGVAGEEVYEEKGGAPVLDRKRLAAIIFNDSEKREAVNRTVHAAVRRHVKEWLAEDDNNIFVETAIAAQSGICRDAEEIWMVDASEATRIERVERRDARGREEITRIMAAQAEEEARLKTSGIKMEIIPDNPGDRLLGRVNELIKSLK